MLGFDQNCHWCQYLFTENIAQCNKTVRFGAFQGLSNTHYILPILSGQFFLPAN